MLKSIAVLVALIISRIQENVSKCLSYEFATENTPQRGEKMKFQHFVFVIDKRFPYYPKKAEHIGINLTSLGAPFDGCVRATEPYHMRARMCGLG